MESLEKGPLIFDLSTRTKLKLSGKEAQNLLHSLGTQDIVSLSVGKAAHCAFLDRFGKVQADCWVYRFSDHFILEANEAQRHSLPALLGRYARLASVAMEDVTDSLRLFSVQGAGALASLGEYPGAFERSRSGYPGFDVFIPIGEQMPGGMAGFAILEAARIGAGIPDFAKDVTPQSLVLEGGFDDAISMTKGCYVGQEIVSRMKNLGGQAPFRLGVVTVGGPAARGDAVRSGELEVGIVTSAAQVGGGTVCLCRIRSEQLPTAVGGIPAEPKKFL